MTQRPSAVVGAEQLWIERPGGAFVAAAWFAPCGPRARSTGVLVVPGPAHEERTMAGGLIACAGALAAAGFGALVVDLHGCGQSSGRLDDAGLADHWRADLRAAHRALRSRGHDAVIVVGVRLGALLAAEALGDARARGFVGWMPVTSGRRHLRELRLLAGATPDAPLSVGGFDWPAPLVTHLARLELPPIDAGAALVLDADERAARGFATACAAPVERRQANDSGAWLFGDRDQPTLPDADIATLTRWCIAVDDRNDAGADDEPARKRQAPLPAASIGFVHRGRRVVEEAVRIGPGRLHGVLCRPADAPAAGAVRLLASTVGPGRTFVDFARDQAAAGHLSLRFDFAGYGISPPAAGERGGRVYAPGGAGDVAAAVAHLRAAGHTRIVPIGYCAGAWSMLQAGAAGDWSGDAGIATIVAINVQLQHVPETAAVTVQRAGPVARLALRVKRWRGLRRLAGRPGRAGRPVPARWVATLADAGVPLLLAYADRDPGLAHARRQFDGLAGVRIDIVERLGHLAENSTARDVLYARIAASLAAVDAAPEVAAHAKPAAPAIAVRTRRAAVPRGGRPTPARLADAWLVESMI